MVLSVLENILFYKYSHRYYLFTNIYIGTNCVEASRYISSELVEGIDEIPDLVVDVGDQLLDLPLGVQRLDGLGVRVVADTERTGNRRRKVAANA